jgi:hypothetical protein
VRVFLSYRADSEGPFARRLSRDLERRGIPIWTASRDADPGSTWPQAIEAGLRACTHVVVLVAEGTLESASLAHELQVAEMLQLDGRATLVPALLDRVELPEWLHASSAVDLTGGFAGYADGYADGLEALAAALRQSATEAAPTERRIVHRVRRGDRIDLLAAQYLGEPTQWRLIAEQNPGVDVAALEPGTVVSIRTRG